MTKRWGPNLRSEMGTTKRLATHRARYEARREIAHTFIEDGAPVYFNELGHVVPALGHAPKIFIRDGQPYSIGSK